MPSDYKQICNDNMRRRGEEFDDIGRLISERLYSDRTHFIYELLQNAEDALNRRKQNYPESIFPTKVKFFLYNNRLEFRHFGDKFNTNDVKAITDVLKGTKSSDKTQIGKFGIGFKSVYAFTSKPEIHSGDEHFVIERFIRPRGIDRASRMADGETVFVFPFDHESFSKEDAFNSIEKKLKEIGSRVLLFLKNISEIEWTILDEDEGLYLKQTEQNGRSVKRVHVMGKHKDVEEEEEWLVFNRDPNNNNSSECVGIEVAFRLHNDGNSNKRVIRRIEKSPLVVYFPTSLETCLGFLVQGPYETTASRADIENNDKNEKIIKETALLITEKVLPAVKEMGLLTVSFIESLPIKSGDFPTESFFRSIYDEVRSSLRYEDFLPTADGGYVAGKNAVLARGEDMVPLLNSKQLHTLLGNTNESQTYEWLSTEITESKQSLYRYLVGWKPNFYETSEEIDPLIIGEIRPKKMIEMITLDFIKGQNSKWLKKLYGFMNDKSSLIETLCMKPIILLQNGTYVTPYKEDGSPNAYLQPDNETEFPVVSDEITKDEKALEFLKDKIKLTEPNVVAEVIERIIPKYTQEHIEVSDDEHMRDINKIILAYDTDSREDKNRLKEKLQETPFVRAENHVSKKEKLLRPNELYLQGQNRSMYFEGNMNMWFISSKYNVEIIELVRNLGTKEMINLNSNKALSNLHEIVRIEKRKRKHVRNVNGSYPFIEIDGLKFALNNLNLQKSRFIWNEIAIENLKSIKGVVETSSNRNYNKYVIKTPWISEKFGRLLMEIEWLPDNQEKYHRPGDLYLDDLPVSFIRDESLAKQLEMKKDVLVKLAEEAGVSVEAIIKMRLYDKTTPATQKRIVALLQNQNGGLPKFPTGSSLNHERRKKKLLEKIASAPKKKYEKREQSMRTTKGTIDPNQWLMEFYTNDEDQMVCQICKNEMPFKKRNSKYYFEAVEALSREYFTKEDEAQYLALCPLCAAMYKEFVKCDEFAMASLRDALMEVEDAEVPLRLGELSTSLRFVETHFQNIKVIIELES